jgi:hypothetical protein
MALRESLAQGPRQLLLAGFGVGLSWAAASLEIDKAVVPELVIVPDDTPAMATG